MILTYTNLNVLFAQYVIMRLFRLEKKNFQRKGCNMRAIEGLGLSIIYCM